MVTERSRKKDKYVSRKYKTYPQNIKKLKGKHHGGIKVKYLQIRVKFRNLKDYLGRDKKRSVGNLHPFTLLCNTLFPNHLTTLPASTCQQIHSANK